MTSTANSFPVSMVVPIVKLPAGHHRKLITGTNVFASPAVAAAKVSRIAVSDGLVSPHDVKKTSTDANASTQKLKRQMPVERTVMACKFRLSIHCESLPKGALFELWDAPNLEIRARRLVDSPICIDLNWEEFGNGLTFRKGEFASYLNRMTGDRVLDSCRRTIH